MRHYLAIDIGAESGRLILGSVSSENLILKEIHRFPNGMVCLQGKYYWNIAQLYKEILIGLEKFVGQEKIIPESIGIDTWGVDYGLLSKDGTLLGMPYTYRDQRTKNAIEEFTGIIPARDLYSRTGTLLASYNTIFQLFAANKSHPEIIAVAANLLFIPDLITYFLTGVKKTEHSYATTSQLLNPEKRDWDEYLFKLLGISSSIMQEVVEPEMFIGNINSEICRQTGMKSIPVVAVATHDTNSAVTAIPAKGENWAFISSGTWSVLGFENDSPVINDQSFQLNFTNEGGNRNTYHILKNLMGFWPLQECRRMWKAKNYSYPDMIAMAERAIPFKAFIDNEYPGFLNPQDMTVEINEYLRRTKQSLPNDHKEYSRIILESLAMKYRQTIDQIELLGQKPINEVYITGGGINNQLLCQFTANATNRVVFTGLAEGTAAGNILAQALASGQFNSLKDIRRIVMNSCDMRVYHPENTKSWEESYQNYFRLTENPELK